MTGDPLGTQATSDVRRLLGKFGVVCIGMRHGNNATGKFPFLSIMKYSFLKIVLLSIFLNLFSNHLAIKLTCSIASNK